MPPGFSLHFPPNSPAVHILIYNDYESSGESNAAAAHLRLVPIRPAGAGPAKDWKTGRSAAEPMRLIRRISEFYIDWPDEPGKQSGVRDGAIKPISTY